MRFITNVLKGGTVCFGALLAVCLMYGLFQGVSIGHSSSGPGLEAATFFVFMASMSIGPVAFVVGGLGYGTIRFYGQRKVIRSEAERDARKRRWPR